MGGKARYGIKKVDRWLHSRIIDQPLCRCFQVAMFSYRCRDRAARLGGKAFGARISRKSRRSAECFEERVLLGVMFRHRHRTTRFIRLATPLTGLISPFWSLGNRARVAIQKHSSTFNMR